MGIQVNAAGVKFAKSLIASEAIDESSNWTFTAKDGNALLGENGDDWKNYAKYHLAEDTSESADTKARWKYAFGKNGKIYRRGVIAAKSRAAQQGETQIENAADELLQAIDAKLGIDSADVDACGTSSSAPKMKKGDSVKRVDYLEAPAWMVSKATQSDAGFLKGRAIVTNVGVFAYKNADGSTRMELRPPEEVFHPDSLQSLCMVPMTNNHPQEGEVTPNNSRELQVGSTGDDVRIDGYHVSVPITLTEAQAISDAQNGKSALSCGYSADMEMKSGVWMGVHYDAIQRNIRYNHVALVDVARAGDAARIKMDSAEAIGIDIQKTKKENPSMKKFIIDGVEYDAEAKVIETLVQAQSKVDGLTKEVEKMKADNSALEGERDALKEQNEKLKVDAAQAATVSPEVIEKAVQSRITLLDSARTAGVEVKADMSEMDIKKAVILKASPKSAEKLEKADAAYINARFDGACEMLADLSNAAQQNSDSMLDIPPADANGKQVIADSADAARERMIKDMREGYKRNADGQNIEE